MSGFQVFLDSVAREPLNSEEAMLAQSLKSQPASLVAGIPRLPLQMAELYVLCSLGAVELEQMNVRVDRWWEPASLATTGYLPHLVWDEVVKRLPPAVDRYLLNMSRCLDKLSKALDAMQVDYRKLGLPVVHVNLPESTSEEGMVELLLPDPGHFEMSLAIWTSYADVRFSNRISLVSAMTLDSIQSIVPELPFPW